jgi:hypothetical protein
MGFKNVYATPDDGFVEVTLRVNKEVGGLRCCPSMSEFRQTDSWHVKYDYKQADNFLRDFGSEGVKLLEKSFFV